MKIISRVMALFVVALFAGCAAQTGGGSAMAPSSGQALSITTPATLSNVSSPLQVCMSTNGYAVEPAKNGVNPGKGHHHLIIDESIPRDLRQPVAKDDTHIHMGDGSKCKTINLTKGQHTIRALFAQGNHVPYNPPVTAAVTVTVVQVN